MRVTMFPAPVYCFEHVGEGSTSNGAESGLYHTQSKRKSTTNYG